MDMIAGASELEWRIACQSHWRQAAAVQEGRQSARDPDDDQVVELGEGVRLYRPEAVERSSNGRSWIVHQQRCKHLIDGWWQLTTVDLAADAPIAALPHPH
jgi:hypothetical protein